ncbi:MAG: sulfatase [Rikenellaceae bacterium]
MKLQKSLLSILGLATLSAQAKNEKPNILFVFVDDLGYADVGFNGSTFYETPNIDAMAKESLVFKYSYMYPTSSPSRTALITGQQSFRTGVYNVPVLEKGNNQSSIFSRWSIGKQFPFYSEQLAKVGYKNVHLGKWHLVGPYPEREEKANFKFNKKLTQPKPGDHSWVSTHKSKHIAETYYPEGRGFVKNVGGTYRGDPALAEGGYDCVGGGYKAPFPNPYIEAKDSDEWLTDRLTDEAIEFMDANKKEPFFINLHYYTVHRPVIARSEELKQKYMQKKGDPVLGQGMEQGKDREDVAAYATMIENLDYNFARLVKYLKDNKLYDNTVIVFSSDNGYNVGSNKLLRGRKQQVYEGGVRVPTFIHHPKMIKPRVSETAISVLDYFPTFIELAGIKDYQGTLDGNSLVPMFKKEDKALATRPIFWQLSSMGRHGTCTAMRFGDYKVIEFLATGKLEVYDLSKDAAEKVNLALSDEALAVRMRDMLSSWRQENDVPLPLNSVVK